MGYSSLIGMPASGKSTIGVVAAKRLGYEFIDTDLLIQKQEKRKLGEIIASEGIEDFLKIEDRVNASIEAENAVIAPGGSVVYCENAMTHYKEMGTVVYLEVSLSKIRRRIGNPRKRGVVLKKGQSLKDLYEERKTLFEKYADVTISEEGLTIGRTVDKVVELAEKASLD